MNALDYWDAKPEFAVPHALFVNFVFVPNEFNTAFNVLSAFILPLTLQTIKNLAVFVNYILL